MAVTLATQPTQLNIINARSPIFYKFAGCSTNYTYQCSIYITNSAIGTETLYETIVRTPDLDGYIIIDISEFTANYIKNHLSTVNENAAYIKVSMLELDGDILISTTESDTSIATLGYSEYLNGINYQKIANYVVYPLNSNPSTFSLPNYGDSGSTFQLSVFNCGGMCKIWYTITGSTATATVNLTLPTPPIYPNNWIYSVKCGYWDVVHVHNKIYCDITKPLRVEFQKNNGEVIFYYNINPEPCNGNELNYLKFINKFGTWDILHLKGRVDNSTTITSENYKYNNINTSSMTYLKTGSYHKSFIQAKNKMIVNTGWIEEGFNQKIQELLVSEFVYLNGYDPVIITDSEIKYKQHKYDNLINYTFNLEKAYDTLNNIR